MELIIDANILFSSLIKDSITAHIMFDENIKLYAPEFLLSEFAKYENFILKKTSRNKNEFKEILTSLNEVITVFPQEEYRQFIDKAKHICPDENDVMYFAIALKLDCAIWSNDKKLKEQKVIKIYSTQELVKKLYS